MLSHTSEYALRAVLYVAMHQAEGPVKLERIASSLDVPRNYLSKTLHQLVQAGILDSGRGPHGGFRLAHPPESLRIADVVAPFEPTRLARRCLLGTGECSDEAPCAAHERWKAISGPMHRFFQETTVLDLIQGTAAAPSLPSVAA